MAIRTLEKNKTRIGLWNPGVGGWVVQFYTLVILPRYNTTRARGLTSREWLLTGGHSNFRANAPLLGVLGEGPQGTPCLTWLKQKDAGNELYRFLEDENSRRKKQAHGKNHEVGACLVHATNYSRLRCLNSKENNSDTRLQRGGRNQIIDDCNFGFCVWDGKSLKVWAGTYLCGDLHFKITLKDPFKNTQAAVLRTGWGSEVCEGGGGGEERKPVKRLCAILCTGFGRIYLRMSSGDQEFGLRSNCWIQQLKYPLESPYQSAWVQVLASFQILASC